MKFDLKKIEDIITPVITAMGYIVWSIDIERFKNRVLLRINVDLPLGDERNGIGIDDCSEISKQIGALLDVENMIFGSYVLEVSSPGLNRSLRKREHFERYLNKVVRVVLKEPIDKQYNFVCKI